jgi:hypothetical protein
MDTKKPFHIHVGWWIEERNETIIIRIGDSYYKKSYIKRKIVIKERVIRLGLKMR